MKLFVCKFCRAKHFFFIYTPKFCSRCRGREFQNYSLLEWLVIGIIVAAVWKIFS